MTRSSTQKQRRNDSRRTKRSKIGIISLTTPHEPTPPRADVLERYPVPSTREPTEVDASVGAAAAIAESGIIPVKEPEPQEEPRITTADYYQDMATNEIELTPQAELLLGLDRYVLRVTASERERVHLFLEDVQNYLFSVESRLRVLEDNPLTNGD